MEITVKGIGDINGTLVLPFNKGDEGIGAVALSGLGDDLQTQITKLFTDKDVTGKTGERLTLHSPSAKAMLWGLGKASERTVDSCRSSGAKFFAGLKKRHGKTLTVRPSGWSGDELAAFVEGMILRDYKYDQYKSKADDDEEDDSPIQVTIQCDAQHVDSVGSSANRSAQIATGVFRARDLANAPPNDLFPMAYADLAREWAADKDNVKLRVIEYEEALNLGMGGLCGVGMGSSRKPCMVIFEMNAEVEGEAPVIVGKGITFDTGGISIKPSASMDEMKFDMHGSATVFGLMQALEATGYSGRVTGISCMAENMPDAAAQRPGDVITTYSGKTVEILNTDAEGRLVLSDGLWMAADYNPSYIVDLATLTGAIVVALGHEATGMWTNDDDLGKALVSAGNDCGELVWPMPLTPAFEKEMKDSKIADLRNLGTSRYGGSNTAAAYLKNFVQTCGKGDDEKQIPWAHLDIAGTAWGAKSNVLVANGGTGIHVRTLHHMITDGN